MDIANYLSALESYDNGKRMCATLVILNLLQKISFLLHHNDVSSADINMLFSMLHLRTDSNSEVDVMFLQSYIPDSCFKDVANVLIHFTKSILSSSTNRLDWVYVIPLIHIFGRRIKPFNSAVLNSKEIMWIDTQIDISNLKRAMHNELLR